MDDVKSLKAKCVLPDSKHPYIKSITAGKDNSVEGLQVRDGFYRHAHQAGLTCRNYIEWLHSYDHHLLREC